MLFILHFNYSKRTNDDIKMNIISICSALIIEGGKERWRGAEPPSQWQLDSPCCFLLLVHLLCYSLWLCPFSSIGFNMEVAHWCSMWSSDLLSPHTTNYIWLSCSLFNSPITPLYWSQSWVSCFFCFFLHIKCMYKCVRLCASVSVCVKVKDALFPFLFPLENVSRLALPPSHSCLSSLQLKPDKAQFHHSSPPLSLALLLWLVCLASFSHFRTSFGVPNLYHISHLSLTHLISTPGPPVSFPVGSILLWFLPFVVRSSVVPYFFFSLSLSDLTHCSKCMKRRQSEL